VRITTLLVLTVAVGLAGAARADYVVLSSGRVVKGEVTDNGDTVSLRLHGGGGAELVFRKSDLKSFGKGSPPAPTGGPVPAASAPGASAGRRAAYERRLGNRRRAAELIPDLAADDPKDAASAYKEIVGLNPFPTVAVSAGLRHKEPQVRKFAAQALGYKGDRICASSLVNAAVNDKDASVRRVAARAIGGMRDPAAMGKLIRITSRVKEKDQIERAGDAIRHAGQPAAIEALIGYAVLEVRAAQAKNASLRSVNITSMQSINTGSGGVIQSVNLPIELPSVELTKVKTTVCLPICEILSRATGVSNGRDIARWADWWQANRGTFSFRN